MRPGVPLLHMHGKQKQTQRLEIYQRFLSAKHSIMFATDIAARGLDFPSVDWVVQVDCPEDVETYIHRVGRTARYQAKGKALLFLLPSEEEGMVKKLEAKKVEIGQIKANAKKQQSVQSQLQSAAFQFPEIKFLAQRVSGKGAVFGCISVAGMLSSEHDAPQAFISYVRSVYLQKDKSIFKLDQLPLEEFAASLGLAGAPKIKFASKQEASAKKNAVRQVEDIKNEVGLKAVAGSDDDESEIASDADDDEEGSTGDGEEEAESAGDDNDGGEESTTGDAIRDKNGGVKTKYDRMFNRKSQTILSDHYGKLVAHSDSENDDASDGESAGKSLANPGVDDNDLDDFITLKRADHDIVDSELPESHFLSKRKLRMGQSKKAMLSKHGNPSKLVFDDEGKGHELYELVGEDDFKAAGDAKEQRQRFVEVEREALAQQDKLDKERAKEQRREKKRKRKAMEAGEDVSPIESFIRREGVLIHAIFSQYDSGAGEGVEIASMDGDDGYIEPDYDHLLGSDPSDDEGEAWYDPEKERAKERARQAKATNKKRRVEREEEDAPPQVDLEALALKALGKR